MDTVTSLAGFRAAIGAGAWVAPNLAGKLFFLDPADNPQSPYLARLFGVRDLALAVGLLGAPPPARAAWLRIGLACDVADTAAALLGGRAGYLSKVTTAAVLGGSLTATALGIKALGEPHPAGA